MIPNRKLLVLPGDGIGPEVMREVGRVVSWMQKRERARFTIVEDLVGGAAIDARGTPLADETIRLAREADAVLFGAVGGPKWEGVDFARRPEAAIIGLRGELGLFANLRPASVLDPLVDASTLKPEVVRGLELMIVRESTGGVYFGLPRGIEELPDGTKRGVNTEVYTTPEIERVARVAFELARNRKKKVTSVDKANVLETSQLWREVVTMLGKEYPDVKLEHMLVDSCAMRIITNPTSFDVVLTENLFGDILTDEAAAISGSLGMLSSATIGGEIDLYEPVHGSAPDIAGKGLANPLGAIASAAMMLRYTAKLEDEAHDIEQAIKEVLASGYRTPDLDNSETKYLLSTEQMGRMVEHALSEQFDRRRSYHAV
jgi:3-isopropylmalate dehydrogenase